MQYMKRSKFNHLPIDFMLSIQPFDDNATGFYRKLDIEKTNLNFIF